MKRIFSLLPGLSLVLAPVLFGMMVDLPRTLIQDYHLEEGSLGYVYRQFTVARAASRPASYGDATSCSGCHEEKQAAVHGSKHQGVKCEACHGPGLAHAASPMETISAPSSGACLACHARDRSRPAGFPQVAAEAHAGEEACGTCHSPHRPEPGKAPKMVAPVPEGANCIPCHGPGSPKPFPPDHVNRSVEVCSRCHAS
ncbi:MAG: multiheme c-type cytochrome [Dehalococcoidia bacterium]|nr:multiheme c-type cytochrome [Dehalococcoidia bacterium]